MIKNCCKINSILINLQPLKSKVLNHYKKNRRGAGVVTEQIANLSTGNRRQGSSPCLSAFNGFCIAQIIFDLLKIKRICQRGVA